jgi:hypothetical protein
MWTSPQELFDVFGEGNVKRWASIENDGNKDKTERRINFFVKLATISAKSRLYGSPAGVIVDPPEDLRYAVTQLAGHRLYSARGIKDATDDKDGRHRMLVHKKESESFMRMVHSGQITLVTNVSRPSTTPLVVPTYTRHPNGSLLTPEQTMQQNMADETDILLSNKGQFIGDA